LRCSQACIFARVELLPHENASDPDYRARALHQVFVQSPHISRYVRSLLLAEGGEEESAMPGRWVFNSPSLVQLLWMLPCLTALSFEAYEPIFDWCDLPNELRRAICGVCQQTNLISLELLNLGVFEDATEFSSLLASSALTDLRLTGISIPSLSDRKGLTGGLLGLTECHFCLSRTSLDGIFQWLGEGELLPRLHHLDLEWEPETTWHLQKIVGASTSTLETLILDLGRLGVHADSSAQPSTELFSLTNMTKLRILELNFTLRADFSNTMVPWLAGLLKSHQHPSTLTDLVLRVQITVSEDLIPLLHPPIDWGPLGSALTQAQFPMLANLKLKIIWLFSDPDNAVKILVDGAKRGLRNLDEMGILKYQHD
ncbi:hypothetical protein B0H11DRAFT_2401991, partial [Mycena galericulata]